MTKEPVRESDDFHHEQTKRMNDGALLQAIQTAESARRKVQHVENLVPDPDPEQDTNDVNMLHITVGDAEHRLNEALEQLHSERKKRGLDRP